MQAANHLFVQAADDFLKNQKAVDAALIFEDQVRLNMKCQYNSFKRGITKITLLNKESLTVKS